MKMWKVYDSDDRQLTDKFWSEKLTWAFGSGELKIKNKFCLKVAIKKFESQYFEWVGHITTNISLLRIWPSLKI
jgi:hypothetical protein